MSTGIDLILNMLVGRDLSTKHRQRLIDKNFERYIAQKKLSNLPEDIAIALQGEALIRSYSLSTASRPPTPSWSPNLTRVNTFETSQSSPPPTPQHIVAKPSVTLKKSQIPEVARPIKQHQSATLGFFETRLHDSQTASQLEYDGKSFRNTVCEFFQADKEKSKTQSTPNTPHRGRVIKESNSNYSWLPEMTGGSGRYRHAVEANASWIEENTISQLGHTDMAWAIWKFATRMDLSFPDGSSIANVASSRFHRAEYSPSKELSHEIDENGMHIFKGFNSSAEALKPILRTKSEVPVQNMGLFHSSPVLTNNVSFSHSGKLVDPFGGPAQASYKTPSLCDSAHPLSQSIRPAIKTQNVPAPRQQIQMEYSDDENAIASDSEDEWLGEAEESGIDTTNAGNAGPSKNISKTIQPMFTINKMLVPQSNLVPAVSLIQEQLQVRYSDDETAVESYTDNKSFEKAFEGAMQTIQAPPNTPEETVKTSVRTRVAVKPQAKTATGSKLTAKVKATRKGPNMKAVRFSKQLVTKIDNEVNVVADHTGSFSTAASSCRSGSSVEMQSQAQQLKAGMQRKDSTDPSSVSSEESLVQQKKLSSKAKGKQRAAEIDGNNSDSSTATVLWSAKGGRKRAVTAVRIPKVEVAIEKVEVYPQPA